MCMVVQSAPGVYLDKPRRSVQRREEVGKEINLARGKSERGGKERYGGSGFKVGKICSPDLDFARRSWRIDAYAE